MSTALAFRERAFTTASRGQPTAATGPAPTSVLILTIAALAAMFAPPRHRTATRGHAVRPHRRRAQEVKHGVVPASISITTPAIAERHVRIGRSAVNSKIALGVFAYLTTKSEASSRFPSQ